VLWQTLADWELIVVGDRCTDDTEVVVRGFPDPRIRFVNLERNFGEQSVPNNEGVRLAQGRFIAYLNHDDLWLPERGRCRTGLSGNALRRGNLRLARARAHD
jgi:glycosyltransferase involved in cell wall biosynthesis